MGTTDTIRQRRVDVWVPSLEAKERWKEAAAERGFSLSRMIIQIVQEAIDGDTRTQGEVDSLQQRILDLEAELAARDATIEDLRTLKNRLETDLESYRAQELLKPEGIKVLDHRLIAILADAKGHDQRQRVVPEEEILRRLRIQPGTVEVQALAMQLEALELHGVIQAKGKGWVWHD